MVALSGDYGVYDADDSDEEESSSSEEESQDDDEEESVGSEDDETEEHPASEGEDDDGSIVDDDGSNVDEDSSDLDGKEDVQETHGIDLPRARDASQLASGSFLSDTAPSLHGMSQANGLGLALEICIVDDADSLRIVAASPVSAGSEVHNTYGELGNRDLVEKYGFALRENPHTSVALEFDPVWTWATENLEDAKRRMDFLETHLPFLVHKRRRYGVVHAHPNGYLPAWAALVLLVLTSDAANDSAWKELADALPVEHLSTWEEVVSKGTGPKRHTAVCCRALARCGGARFREALRALVEPRLETLRAAASDERPQKGFDTSVRTSREERAIASHAARTLRESEIQLLESFL